MTRKQAQDLFVWMYLRLCSEGGAHAYKWRGRYRVVSYATGHDCLVSDDILRAGIDQGLDIKIVP